MRQSYLLLAEGSDRLHSGDESGRALLPSLEASDLMHACRSESSGEHGSGSGGSGCGHGCGIDGCLIRTAGQSCSSL